MNALLKNIGKNSWWKGIGIISDSLLFYIKIQLETCARFLSKRPEEQSGLE